MQCRNFAYPDLNTTVSEEDLLTCLRSTPGLPSLGSIECLKPEFCPLKTAERLRLWNSAREQLERIEKKGVVRCVANERGVTHWSAT
jgi:hypothetical protein